jgi:hypothetical protein
MNPNLSSIDQILKTIGVDITQGATNVAVPQVESLNLALPTYSDMDAQFKNFLNTASQDPGIVNYYNSLFQKAQGDYSTAVQYLEADYQTGVRQQVENTKANLASLGLTFTGESNTLADTLNKRGIALTQEQGGQPQYAAGGEAGTELTNLNNSQTLRQEAEQRSASQNIQNLGLKRQSGISSAGQQLAGNVQNIQGQETQAITNEAQNKYNTYQNQIAATAQQGQNQANYGGGTTDTAPSYKPNTVNQTVSYGGHTFKGNPGSDWSEIS